MFALLLVKTSVAAALPASLYAICGLGNGQRERRERLLTGYNQHARRPEQPSPEKVLPSSHSSSSGTMRESPQSVQLVPVESQA